MPGERDIAASDTTGDDFAPRRYPAIVDRWALLVGISTYAHAPWNLRFAHADAKALAAFVATPAGGGFESDRIELLIDAQATTAALTKRLRSFLKRPARDDIVLLYFACHGAPDPDRPDNLYLLTHDSDPVDISGTALPMREITIALTETLSAERVLVFVDTCHSGDLTLARGTRAAANSAGVMTSHLHELGKARPGIAFLTSADHDQTSREDERWGGGHGVFTHFLLEGMRGRADGYGNSTRDGRVRVGELFDYVCDSVKREVPTQHPTTGRYRFDREMLVATTGRISATEHVALAHRLEHLARRTQEPGRFREAARRYAQARELAQGVGATAVEEELGHARCLLQAGDTGLAAEAFQRLIRRHPDKSLPKAWFYLAIAHATRFDYVGATTALDRVLTADGEHVNSNWVADYRNWLGRRATGRRRALLIGIDRYSIPELALNGCVNDARLLQATLSSDGLFDETRLLLDAEASRQGILKAIASLGDGLDANDQLWVSFSGHSVAEVDRRERDGVALADDYLLACDSVRTEAGYARSISARALHAAMTALPTRRKTLVLDTHPSVELITLAERDGAYTLLLGSDSAELAFETTVERDGKPVTAGLFTAALVSAMQGIERETLTFRELHTRTLEQMRLRDQRQTPLLIGDRDRPVFGVEDIYLAAFDLAKRRDHGMLTPEVLAARCERIDASLSAPWPQYHYGVGRARFHFGDLEGATRSLRLALVQSSNDYPECSLLLARARLALRDDKGAAEALEGQIFHSQAEVPLVNAARDNLLRLRTERRRALLVAIDDERDAPPGVNRDTLADKAGSAVEAMRAMRQTLLREWRFDEQDIIVLHGADATRDHVLAAFDATTKRARGAVTYFHFAGAGATRSDGSRSLCCATASSAASTTGSTARDAVAESFACEIALSELAERARESDMICVIDAVWDHRPASVAPLRASAGDESAADHAARLEEGRIWIINERATPPPRPESTYRADGPRPFESGRAERQAPSARGALTRAFAASSAAWLPPDADVHDWLNEVCTRNGLSVKAPGDIGKTAGGSVTVAGDFSGRRLFENTLLRERCKSGLLQLDRRPLVELIAMLQPSIAECARSGEDCAWAYMSIGVAEAECERIDEATSALAEAISRYEKESAASALIAEACYLLGRTLYRARVDLPRAVDALERALRVEPEDPHVLFHLGRAMIEMIERGTRAKALEYLGRYLDLGAPLGHEFEVRRLLGSRLDDGPDASNATPGKDPAARSGDRSDAFRRHEPPEHVPLARTSA